MTRSVRIVPAILTEDPAALKKMLLQAQEYTDYVQIDIMDSRFVPSRSITWKDIGEIRPGINWEVHLMVENPETQFENYKKAGTQKVIFHYEAAEKSVLKPAEVIEVARKLNLQVGLAVNPETPVSRFVNLADRVDSVLFLSVHPGFYGAKFIPEVLDKIVELRKARPDLSIGIDGGVKATNIGEIAAKGVNEIFVGSAILLAPNPGEAYRSLTSLAKAAV